MKEEKKPEVKRPVGRPKKKRPVGRPRKITPIETAKSIEGKYSKEIIELYEKIDFLESQINGYRVVISYLEDQLGLRQTQ